MLADCSVVSFIGCFHRSKSLPCQLAWKLAGHSKLVPDVHPSAHSSALFNYDKVELTDLNQADNHIVHMPRSASLGRLPSLTVPS